MLGLVDICPGRNKRRGRVLLKHLLEQLLNLRGDGEPSIQRNSGKQQFSGWSADKEDAAIAPTHDENSVGESRPLHAQ
jgi:hypothetical protein